jgi:hypothetical protein
MFEEMYWSVSRSVRQAFQVLQESLWCQQVGGSYKRKGGGTTSKGQEIFLSMIKYLAITKV